MRHHFVARGRRLGGRGALRQHLHDKAADPISVLGHTKRLAERLTAHAAIDSEGTYLSVRFGNVLGSRGSVLTAFTAQIEKGGPVTVTDPDVTRFFITVEEAVQLVIQAGAVGRAGEALVLDMGDPVRIDDVARRLIAEADRPVEVVYTELRPGEKLHEILFSGAEDDERPSHPGISHFRVPPLHKDEVPAIDVDGADLVPLLAEACDRADLDTPQSPILGRFASSGAGRAGGRGRWPAPLRDLPRGAPPATRRAAGT